jgi:hypothetical protein
VGLATGTLSILPFKALRKADRDGLAAEGERLLDFATGPDVTKKVEFLAPGYRTSP